MESNPHYIRTVQLNPNWHVQKTEMRNGHLWFFGTHKHIHARRGIALIHEETQSLLGNFRELIHTSVPGCRRLVLESGLLQIDATEYVAGAWWAAEMPQLQRRADWMTKRFLHLDIALTSPAVHAPAVFIEAHIAYGGIARVELLLETTFLAGEEGITSLLVLPVGTNILPVLEWTVKLTLRKELGL